MRALFRSVVATTFAATLFAPAVARAQGAASVGGFGGLTLSTSPSQPRSLGGAVTFDLSRSVQVIGEVGRLGNVMPPIADAVFTAAGADLRATAIYGDGGVRLLAAPSSHVTPYGEATVGMARLDVSSPKFGALGNAAASIALSLVGRTAPVAGAGGGVLVRTGPIVFDVGYRYKQLFADDILQVALGFGQPLRTHQVRAGIAVRF